jgi:hypothetical protein
LTDYLPPLSVVGGEALNLVGVPLIALDGIQGSNYILAFFFVVHVLEILETGYVVW